MALILMGLTVFFTLITLAGLALLRTEIKLPHTRAHVISLAD
jgi:hypothetical protein